MKNDIESNAEAGSHVENGLPAEAIDKAVKALISLSSSAKEANDVIREFKPEFDYNDTIQLLQKKFSYVKRLFNIDEDAACNSDEASLLEQAATDYYSLLSVLILRKWG